MPQLGRQVLHDANEFRRTCCYTEAVDAVLREHEQSLRAMFERYAAADSQGERDGTRWLGYAEWAEFVEDLGLIDGAFTLREATLCFACSRMLVVDETTPLGWRRTTNLTFEDFLEAFVRAALLKPLPTPAEVQKAGYRDAGEFVLKMRTDDPAGWNNWATKHTVTCAPAPPAPRGAPLRERRGSAAHRREGGMALRLPSQRAGLQCLSLSLLTAASSGRWSGKGRSGRCLLTRARGAGSRAQTRRLLAAAPHCSLASHATHPSALHACFFLGRWEAAMQAEEAEPGKLAYPKLRQPVERCVEALLMLMVRTADVSGDARISRQEAAMFDSKN